MNFSRVLSCCHWIQASPPALQTPYNPHVNTRVWVYLVSQRAFTWLSKSSTFMLYILQPTYNSQEQYGLCHSDSGINISDDFAVTTLQAIPFPKISWVSDCHLVFKFTLFIIYSSVHSLLWLMVNDSNWQQGFVIMVIISWQVWNVMLKNWYKGSFYFILV